MDKKVAERIIRSLGIYDEKDIAKQLNLFETMMKGGDKAMSDVMIHPIDEILTQIVDDMDAMTDQEVFEWSRVMKIMTPDLARSGPESGLDSLISLARLGFIVALKAQTDRKVVEAELERED